MQSTFLLQMFSSAGSSRLTAAVAGRAALLIALVAFHVNAQSAGTIASHRLPEMGVAVVDQQQDVYIAGGGGCAGGFQAPFTCAPMVIVKASPAGSTIFSYTDSADGVSPRSLAVNSSGEVVVVGTRLTGGGFAAKLSADGSRLLYFSQLPSSLLSPEAVQTDSQGDAYIVGMTSDFHPFVTKLSADGTTFSYTTKFIGSAASAASPDGAFALALDASGDVFITGWTNSSDFPVTPGAAQPKFAGPTEAFLAKLDASGKIVASTFLGGSGGAYGQAIQLDSAGNIYVAGVAGSGFPTTPGTYQPTPIIPLWSLGTSGFVAKLTPMADAIVWATYSVSNGVAPTASDVGVNPIFLAVTPTGEVYVATDTRSGFISTASAHSPVLAAGPPRIRFLCTSRRVAFWPIPHILEPNRLPSACSCQATGRL